MFKESYPNYSDYLPSKPHYDLVKWMGAMKNILFKTNHGIPEKQAFDTTTKEWDHNESFDFSNWMRYYQSGDAEKYKTAQQSYYVNEDINYFLPNPAVPKQEIPSPLRTINDIKNYQEQRKELTKEDKRKIIEDQRRKILTRLNSAEKILSSEQGHIFAGPDFERLLVAIYDLKKQIQTVNKVSLSAQTCVDLIIRQANILSKQGFSGASEFMTKFAQSTPGDFSFNMGEVPSGGSQPQGKGSLDNNAPTGQSLLTPPPDKAKDDKDAPQTGVAGFLENMEGSGITLFDNKENEKLDTDENKASDEISLDDNNDSVELDCESMFSNDNDLVVEAQEMPEERKPTLKPSKDMKAPVKEPTVEDVKNGPKLPERNNYDELIDAAFANLTVDDIVKKLESINNIFRNREISRQLAIVDLMLKKLDLNAFFPELGESASKSLEMNQYCLTRVESAISRLRGSSKTQELDLENKNRKPPSQEASNIKNNLQNDENKEKESKEIRKKIQDQKQLEPTKPELEVESPAEEIGAEPASVEKPIAPKPAQVPAV